MITPSGFAAARFDIQVVSADDVREREVNKDVLPWQIKVMLAVAKDDKEGKRIENNIHSLVDNDMLRSGRVIIVDASSSPLGMKELESYADAVARADIYQQIDIPTSERHRRSAAEVLDQWKSRISSGRFTVYAANSGEAKSDNVTGADSLLSKLREADLCPYPNELETGTTVLDNMWSTEHPNIRQGAECGANEEVKGTFKNNNPNMQLSNFIGASVWRANKDMNGNADRAALWVYAL